MSKSFKIMVILAALGVSPQLFATQYIQLGAGGIMMPLHGSLMSVGARFSDNKEVELSGYISDDRESDVQIRGSYYAFRFKQFLSKSFYIAPGVGHRILSGSFNNTEDDYLSKRRADAFGLEFSFGNLWIKNNVRFGIDYLGYFLPAMSTGTTNRFRYLESGKFRAISDESLDDPECVRMRCTSEKKWAASKWDKLNNQGNWQFLRLQFGYQF